MIFLFYILSVQYVFPSLCSDTHKYFMWGTATAAYQIEGAYNIDNRGLSVWDDFSHNSNKTVNDENGDVADDHYHQFEHDIYLMSKLGIDAYRMSISWTRILPSGKADSVNSLGVEYYNNVIDTLLKYNITPLITLYHWDTPLQLEQELSGWLNPAMVDLFADYARVCFELFGDRVEHWLTINEPMTVAINGYLTGEHAPGRCSDRDLCAAGNSSTEPYIVAHNMLNAHAAAVCAFRKLKGVGGGQIGMAINTDFAYPYDNTNIQDMLAAQRDLEFQAGWFADPLYFGDYPDSMKLLVGDRLPIFTAQQKKLLKGSVDFYALNHYSSRYYRANYTRTENTGDWFVDQQSDVLNVNASGHVIGPIADSEWLNVVPEGIHDVLVWLKDRYGNPDIYITENGVDVPGESDLPLQEALNDTFRVDFYRDYLHHVMKAKELNDVNVVGYFAWSLMDNFEWSDGYHCRFGLHYVDYTDEKLTRYRKKSSFFYEQYILNYKRKHETGDKNAMHA